MSGSRWQSTPAYDLPSSQPYGDTTLALSVAGSRGQDISGKRYLGLGAVLGLPERAARRIVERVASSADDWLSGVPEIPFERGQVRKLERVIRNRQRMLLQT